MRTQLLLLAALGALMLVPLVGAHPLEVGAGGIVIGYVDPHPDHLIFEGHVPPDGYHFYLEDNGCPHLQKTEADALAVGCTKADTKVA